MSVIIAKILSIISKPLMILTGGALIGSVATFFIVNNIKQVEISKLNYQIEHIQKINTEAALNKLSNIIISMHMADTEYFQSLSDINRQYDEIRKEMKNVKKPLPVDCKPDNERVRILSRAIDAANSATQPGAGRAVP